MLVLLMALTLGQVEYNELPQMSAEFIGEPKTVGQMRIGDSFWVPAHALMVDKHAKCWLDPKCKLNEDSDHKIRVTRYKSTQSPRQGGKTVIGYKVSIDRKKLQGWRWKMMDVQRTNIPVRGLTIYGDAH
jgi:hypothetical protein